MFKLEFNEFMNYYETAMRTRNEDRRVLHYFEDDSQFILYIKSIDYWKYFTIVLKDDIETFGNNFGASREKSIADFKMNLLYSAVKVEEKPQQVEKTVMKKEAPIEEAKDYEGFLKKEFSEWERKILSFVDETLSKEVVEKDFKKIDKSFGEFMRRVFNVVNTSNFAGKLKAIVKERINDGVEEAELELDVDIGFGPEMDDRVENITRRQLDGFFIDGKPWAGIKGVTEELQREIRESVVKNIEQKSDLKEMKKDIRDIFNKYTGDKETEGRVMKIARTESSRIRNAAKQEAYRKSGIVQKKKWETFFDVRTDGGATAHEIHGVCKRLHNQEVWLDEPFTDPMTGKKYDQPPSPHPNCRCTLSAVLK